MGSTSNDYERSGWGSSADNESVWAPPQSVSLPQGGARGGFLAPMDGQAAPGGPPPFLVPTNGLVTLGGSLPALVSTTAPGGLAAPGGPHPAMVGPKPPGGPPPLPPLGPHLEAPIPLLVVWFTLPPIKSGDDYFQYHDLILFWLHTPGFSTARDD